MNRVLVSRMAFPGLFVISFCTAAAGDGWFAQAPRTIAPPPARGLFGLPVPRQWAGQQSGQVSGPCVNGRCPTPLRTNLFSTSGSTATGVNCPSGKCPLPANNDGWTARPVGSSRAIGSFKPVVPPRGERTGTPARTEPSDPFRPVTAPLRDAFGSGYDSRELDLRSNYFRRDDGERQPSRGGSTGRSLEMPQELPAGTARI